MDDDAPFTGDLNLEAVTTHDQLSMLLRTVHMRADKPSLRTLETRTRHATTPLSKTVVSEMLNGARFPRKAVMVAFLRACGIPDEYMDQWRRAWERVASGGSRQTGPGVGSTLIAWQPESASEPGQRRSAPTPGHAASAITTSDADLSEDRSLELGSEPRTVGEQRQQLDVTERPLAKAALVETQRENEADNTNKSYNPVVRRRELGARLRALRSESGLTVAQVAEQLMYSPSKISRMESGYRSVTLRDIRDVCDLYGVTDAASREQLMELARESRQQSWWQSYDQPYSTYIGLEVDAKYIKNFHSSVIPELLQTAEYARSQYERTAVRPLEPDVIEQRIEVIRIRQRLLAQADPPQFWAIVDEAALRRLVGSSEVMKAQLARLIEVSMWPNITIQVIPYEAGAHPAADSCFTTFQFAGSAPAVVYVKGLVGAIYLERPDDISRYNHVFQILSEIALNPVRSLNLITRIISELKRIL